MITQETLNKLADIYQSLGYDVKLKLNEDVAKIYVYGENVSDMPVNGSYEDYDSIGSITEDIGDYIEEEADARDMEW